MRFAAALEACPACGSHQLGALDLTGSDSQWRYTGACPACGAQRAFEFTTIGDPRLARAGRFELGDGASEVISAEQFLAVLDGASPRIPAEPPADLAERKSAIAELARAFTSVNELLKLVPVGEALMPGSTDVRLKRPWVEREYIRLRKLTSRYRPSSTISQGALDRHREWLKRGGKGDGYLALEGASLTDEFYGPIDLTFASIVNSDLTNVDLGNAILDEATLDRVTLTGAILDNASITNAVITGGTWTRVRLSIAKLNAARVNGTDFSQGDLERSHWFDAKVTGANFGAVRFGNAIFNGAQFERCNFRGATFRKLMPDPAPTSSGARFVDCDFSGVSFAERDLRDTVFVRCKLAGVHAPLSGGTTGLVLEDCDLTLDQFLATLPATAPNP